MAGPQGHGGHGALVCAAAMVLICASASAGRVGDPDVHVVLVAHGQRVLASPSSSTKTIHFANGVSEIVHGDYVPRLRGRLTMHRGQRVLMLTASPAVSISAQLVTSSSPTRSVTLKVTRLDRRGHRWAFVVPRHTGRRAGRLMFDVVYPVQKDVSFEAAVRIATTQSTSTGRRLLHRR